MSKFIDYALGHARPIARLRGALGAAEEAQAAVVEHDDELLGRSRVDRIRLVRLVARGHVASGTLGDRADRVLSSIGCRSRSVKQNFPA